MDIQIHKSVDGEFFVYDNGDDEHEYIFDTWVEVLAWIEFYFGNDIKE